MSRVRTHVHLVDSDEVSAMLVNDDQKDEILAITFGYPETCVYIEPSHSSYAGFCEHFKLKAAK